MTVTVYDTGLRFPSSSEPVPCFGGGFFLWLTPRGGPFFLILEGLCGW